MYDVKSQTNEKMVCKLEKSLYGLKQSGRNWNKMLHNYLYKNIFVQNQADHCVYKRETEHENVMISVDDLVIAESFKDCKRDAYWEIPDEIFGKTEEFSRYHF